MGGEGFFHWKIDILFSLKSFVQDCSITNLATTSALNAKINEVKGKIPNITNLGTTAALTAVENKIPNVSNLVKKTDYNTKISEIENKITTDHGHDKYITTQKFIKLTAENFIARLAQTYLVTQSDIVNFVKKQILIMKYKILLQIEIDWTNYIYQKNTPISTNGLTKDFINKFSIFDRAKCFRSGIFQYYSVFTLVKKYIK